MTAPRLRSNRTAALPRVARRTWFLTINGVPATALGFGSYSSTVQWLTLHPVPVDAIIRIVCQGKVYFESTIDGLLDDPPTL